MHTVDEWWISHFPKPLFIASYQSQSRSGEDITTFITGAWVRSEDSVVMWGCICVLCEKASWKTPKMFLNKSTKNFYSTKCSNHQTSMLRWSKKIWWVKPRLLGESCATFTLVESKENGNQTSKDKKLGQQDFGKKHHFNISVSCDIYCDMTGQFPR